MILVFYWKILVVISSTGSHNNIFILTEELPLITTLNIYKPRHIQKTIRISIQRQKNRIKTQRKNKITFDALIDSKVHPNTLKISYTNWIVSLILKLLIIINLQETLNILLVLFSPITPFLKIIFVILLLCILIKNPILMLRLVKHLNRLMPSIKKLKP